MSFAGGETKGGLAEFNLFDVAAKSLLSLTLSYAFSFQETRLLEIRYMSHDVRGLVD